MKGAGRRGSRLLLPRRHYPRASLEAAALALGDRARVVLRPLGGRYEVVISSGRSRRKGEGGDLAGEFLNEALSFAYRQKVVRFNRDLSSALLAAMLSRGFARVPEDPLEQLEPQVKADRRRETEALLEAAGGAG